MAPVRIGTCSWADDALNRYWYPKGLPAKERLAWYAERFSTVEVDSTFYRTPLTSRWCRTQADRTPDGFVMHVKAFGLMTRHPVKLEQLPPDLRDGMPLDARGRVDRPEPEQRAIVFREFLGALEPLRAAGKLGGILFQMPPYIVPKPSSFAYLEWARDQLGGDEMLVEFRHRDWFAEDRRAELLGWLEERRMSLVAVDAPRLDAANVPETLLAVTGLDRLRPLPRPECRHLEQARRRRSPALRLHLRRRGARRLGRAAPRAQLGSRTDLRLLQQQQPDRRRRSGTGRSRAPAPPAQRGGRPRGLRPRDWAGLDLGRRYGHFIRSG